MTNQLTGDIDAHVLSPPLTNVAGESPVIRRMIKAHVVSAKCFDQWHRVRVRHTLCTHYMCTAVLTFNTCSELFHELSKNRFVE